MCLATVLQLIDLRVAFVDSGHLLDDVFDEVVEHPCLPMKLLPTAFVGSVEVESLLCAEVGIGNRLAKLVGIAVFHAGEERGAAHGETKVLGGSRVIVEGGEGVDVAVVGVGHFGDTAFFIVLLNLISLPGKPSNGCRNGHLRIDSRLVLHDKGVDALGDMRYRLTHVVRTVDVVLVVSTKLHVVSVRRCSDEVGISAQGVVIIDARPSLLAFLCGIGEVVVGVERILEGVVPQPALQRERGSQTSLGMEVDLVLVPFGIDTKLRFAVLS